MNLLTAQLETPAQESARAIASNIQSIKTTVFGVLRDSQKRLDQGTLDVFGPLASQIFAELEELVKYAMDRMKANEDAEGLAELGGILAAMPQVEVNKDGTVKIIPPPVPEPAPEDMKFTPIENQM